MVPAAAQSNTALFIHNMRLAVLLVCFVLGADEGRSGTAWDDVLDKVKGECWGRL